MMKAASHSPTMRVEHDEYEYNGIAESIEFWYYQSSGESARGVIQVQLQNGRIKRVFNYEDGEEYSEDRIQMGNSNMSLVEAESLLTTWVRHGIWQLRNGRVDENGNRINEVAV